MRGEEGGRRKTRRGKEGRRKGKEGKEVRGGREEGDTVFSITLENNCSDWSVGSVTPLPF